MIKRKSSKQPAKKGYIIYGETEIRWQISHWKQCKWEHSGGDISKIQKENLWAKISFKKQRQNKDILRHIKAKGIHYQQSCTIRNVKESLSDRRKMIPDGNTDLHNE